MKKELEEAIKHAEEVAEENEKSLRRWEECKNRGTIGWSDYDKEKVDMSITRCRECAAEHHQLAEWLKDYKWLLDREPCEDVISRQAVLDLIEHYNSDGLGSIFYSYEEGLKFTDAVNKLPSVQPEPTTGVLNKIRAEIENHCGLAKENHCKYCSYCNNVMGVREILEIIDKYKAEKRG